MNHRVQTTKRAALIVVLLVLVLLAASPLAAGQWTQTDWSGGKATEVVTTTTTKYRTGENENVLLAGLVRLENKFYVSERAWYYHENNTRLTTTSTTWVHFTGHKFTPTAGDYLIMAVATVNMSNDYNTTMVRMLVDGTTYAEENFSAAGSGAQNRYILAAHRIMNLTAEEHTIKLEFGKLDAAAGTAGIENGRIIVMKVANYGTAENNAIAATTSTTYVDRTTLDYTTAADNYLLLATAEKGANNPSDPVFAKLIYDTVTQAEWNKKHNLGSSENIYSLAVMRRIDATAAAHTAKLQYCTSAATTEARIRNARVSMVRLSDLAGAFYDNESEDVSYTTSATTPADKVSVTFTSGVTDNYLIIASAIIGADQTGTQDYVTAFTDVDGRRIDNVTYRPRATTDNIPYFALQRVSLAAGDHTIKIQFMVGGGGCTGVIRNARLMVIRQTENINRHKPAAYLESSVFDAGDNTNWQTVTWNAIAPSGVGADNVKVYLRSGPDSDPSSGNWSPSWRKHDNNSENASLENNRYVQYRVELTTADNRVTPEFLDISISYSSFSISPSTTSVTVILGSSSSTIITAKLKAGSIGSVTFNGSWVGATAPTGVTASFSPSSVSPTAAGENSVLKFEAASNATTGTYTYRVKAQEGTGLTQTLDITVSVAAFDFSVSAFPDNLSMVRGETKTSTVRVSAVAGTQGPVSLSGAWVGYAAGQGPAGVDMASPSPTSGTPTFESNLTVSVSDAAVGGNFLYRVTATGGGISRETNVRVIVNVGLTLTLTTDKDNYNKSEWIRVSGTVKDPRGNLVENGTATVRFICENWSRFDNVRIRNGAYSDNYYVSFADPDGTWTIKVEAVDNIKNTGEATKFIGVGTPAGVGYFKVEILSPVEGLTYTRGTKVSISIKVTKDDTPVDNVTVYFTLPSGEKIPLSGLAPGTGVYTGTYTLGWADPEGSWVVSAEGTKTVEGALMVGGKWINTRITPAALQVSLLSPGNQVEVGESVWIKVKVLYPNGDPVGDATVTVTIPTGDNLTLERESPGTYSKLYTITSRDVGRWTLGVRASDSYGNSFSKEDVSVVEVGTMGPLRFMTAYWWAFLAIFASIGVTSAYLGWRAMLVRRLRGVRREIREIPKLKKEAMIKYFREGSIERDTYDEMMDKHDMRLGELRKEEELLRAKVEKPRVKRVRGLKKRRK